MPISPQQFLDQSTPNYSIICTPPYFYKLAGSVRGVNGMRVANRWEALFQTT